MATSKFQDVRAALVTLISPITNCVITQYPPYGDEFTREDRVWIGRIRSEQVPLSMGGVSGIRDEDLEITLMIYVPRDGAGQDDWAAAETRAEAILAAIEADLKSGPTIGGTVMTSDLAAFESSVDTIDDRGPICQLEVTITAEANL